MRSPTSVDLGPPASEVAARLLQHLPRMIPHRESAAHIGRAYLRMVPADAAGLLDLLCAPMSQALRSPAAIEGYALEDLLRTRKMDDFAAGRVVLIDGWMLSETEARLCALVALA
jgi:hypothetical protein